MLNLRSIIMLSFFCISLTVEKMSSYQDLFHILSHIMSKVMVIQNNAEHFKDNCYLFDIANEDLDNGVAQTAWDSVAPTISKGYKRSILGTFQTLQEGLEGNIY